MRSPCSAQRAPKVAFVHLGVTRANPVLTRKTPARHFSSDPSVSAIPARCRHVSRATGRSRIRQLSSNLLQRRGRAIACVLAVQCDAGHDAILLVARGHDNPQRRPVAPTPRLDGDRRAGPVVRAALLAVDVPDAQRVQDVRLRDVATLHAAEGVFAEGHGSLSPACSPWIVLFPSRLRVGTSAGPEESGCRQSQGRQCDPLFIVFGSRWFCWSGRGEGVMPVFFSSSRPRGTYRQF